MMRPVPVLAMILLILSACGTRQNEPTPLPTASPSSILSKDEAATLGSLELVDDYPLYTMHYTASYRNLGTVSRTSNPGAALGFPVQGSCGEGWGCSLFAALGDERNRLYGRNFDWQFSPAMLLFTGPDDGYASVSMVDISYLGFGGARSKDLEHLPLEDRQGLLDAPSLAFDGMNEMGLAVGMAAVPPGNMPRDPQKKTLDELQVIREVLDHAGTVEEAIKILGSYNIDMGTVPIHYLVASASGKSAVVEFHEGRIVVFRNQASWQAATNFLLSSTGDHPERQCWRYDRITKQLSELQGRILPPDAMRVLEDVSQDNTQWSVVYHMTTSDIDIVMGRSYSTVHTFHLDHGVQ